MSDEELFFAPHLPAEAIGRLIRNAPKDPVGVVTVDAAFHLGGCANAYRRGGPIPAAAEPPVEGGYRPPEDIEGLCEAIKAETAKHQPVPASALPNEPAAFIPSGLLDLLVKKLVAKILSRILQE